MTNNERLMLFKSLIGWGQAKSAGDTYISSYFAVKSWFVEFNCYGEALITIQFR